jgi:signal transduction histidine kinase
LSLNFQRECDIKELQVDPELVTEAVSILLTNAINYTPSGGQILVKTLAASHQDQRMFGVQVSDTGPGIPKEEQSRLFERFFRGKVGQESGISGTGLGLAIVKEIIDRHNGSVDVVSEAIPGKGTTFTIWLPA